MQSDGARRSGFAHRLQRPANIRKTHAVIMRQHFVFSMADIRQIVLQQQIHRAFFALRDAALRKAFDVRRDFIRRRIRLTQSLHHRSQVHTGNSGLKIIIARLHDNLAQ